MENSTLNNKLMYDLDAIMDFIFSDDTRDNSVEITESQTPDDNGKLVTDNKVIHELKANDSNKCTIKYDMIKLFMEVINNVEINQELMPLSLGERMILNSMISRGLVKEINGGDE